MRNGSMLGTWIRAALERTSKAGAFLKGERAGSTTRKSIMIGFVGLAVLLSSALLVSTWFMIKGTTS
jgi:hypothetical protein